MRFWDWRRCFCFNVYNIHVIKMPDINSAFFLVPTLCVGMHSFSLVCLLILHRALKIPFSPAGESLSLLVQRRVTKETHPRPVCPYGVPSHHPLCLRAGSVRHPCLISPKFAIQANLPGQSGRCSANRMGTQNQNTAKKKKKA